MTICYRRDANKYLYRTLYNSTCTHVVDWTERHSKEDHYFDGDTSEKDIQQQQDHRSIQLGRDLGRVRTSKGRRQGETCHRRGYHVRPSEIGPWLEGDVGEDGSGEGNMEGFIVVERHGKRIREWDI